jgi:hypothetical protein
MKLVSCSKLHTKNTTVLINTRDILGSKGDEDDVLLGLDAV